MPRIEREIQIRENKYTKVDNVLVEKDRVIKIIIHKGATNSNSIDHLEKFVCEELWSGSKLILFNHSKIIFLIRLNLLFLFVS
jgi:aromatic ring-cleaving dioxygenase